jgi:murein DD-endopeptidase MepM/ murein hydrolase activator NlpD
VAAPAALEIHWTRADGRIRCFRLGRFAAILAGAALLGLVGGLVFSIATLPSLFGTQRVQQEMSMALSRRSQLGERLRALVERSDGVERQVEAHSFRVGRIRSLYGIPELVTVSPAERDDRATGDSIYEGALLYAARRLATIENRLVATDALLGALARWEADHRDEVATVPALFPLATSDVVPTTGFGLQRNPVTGEPEFHAGVDFAAPDGATIRAPAAGVVRWAGEPPPNSGDIWWRFGKVVVLAHGDRYRTIFGHCDRILVRVGARVTAGEPIATVGRVGWAPMPRLHYEVRRRSREGVWDPVDPTTLLLFAPWIEEGASPAPLSRPAGGLTPPPLPGAFGR